MDYAAASKEKGERIKGKINVTTESHGTARIGIYVNNPCPDKIENRVAPDGVPGFLLTF
jgi:hypothetical protein